MGKIFNESENKEPDFSITDLEKHFKKVMEDPISDDIFTIPNGFKEKMKPNCPFQKLYKTG